MRWPQGAADVTEWLAKYWVQGALFMGIALLAPLPLLVHAWGPPLLLIYLHSPGYMFHQVEEHHGDRFRDYINQRVFGGVEAMTAKGVLWANLPGVWGLDLAALYAAGFLVPGDGLAAPYLMLVNAIGHVAMAVRAREYNPGLGTAALLFVPLGLATLAVIAAPLAQHLVGLGAALAIHAAIAIATARRAARLIGR